MGELFRMMVRSSMQKRLKQKFAVAEIILCGARLKQVKNIEKHLSVPLVGTALRTAEAAQNGQLDKFFGKAFGPHTYPLWIWPFIGV